MVADEDVQVPEPADGRGYELRWSLRSGEVEAGVMNAPAVG
jgi:hypothetical protein